MSQKGPLRYSHDFPWLEKLTASFDTFNKSISELTTPQNSSVSVKLALDVVVISSNAEVSENNDKFGSASEEKNSRKAIESENRPSFDESYIIKLLEDIHRKQEHYLVADTRMLQNEIKKLNDIKRQAYEAKKNIKSKGVTAEAKAAAIRERNVHASCILRTNKKLKIAEGKLTVLGLQNEQQALINALTPKLALYQSAKNQYNLYCESFTHRHAQSGEFANRNGTSRKPEP